MASLRGKVVVITGASAGIGAATAVKFAKHGARLVLHGRNESNLKEVVDKCIAEGNITKDDIAVALGDLADDSAVDNVIKTTLDTFGTIHVLFNNAGYLSSKEGPLSVNGRVESLDEMYRITLRVPYMLVQAFVPELVKNKGPIFNCLLYNEGWYGSLDKDFIHSPGFVKTSIGRAFGNAAETFWDSRDALTPLEQKMSTSEDIANVVTFLASDEASSMSGANVMCDRATALTNAVVDFTQYK